MNYGSLLLKWLLFILECCGKCLVFLIKWIWWTLYNVWIFVSCAFVYFFSFIVNCVSWLSSRTGNILSGTVWILLVMSAISPAFAGYVMATCDDIREFFSEAPVVGEICISSPVMCRENTIHIGSTRNFLMFTLNDRASDSGTEDKGKKGVAGGKQDGTEVVVIPRENVSSFGPKRDDGWKLKLPSAENAEALNSIIGSVAEINSKFERIEWLVGTGTEDGPVPSVSLAGRVAQLKSTVEANAQMTRSELQGLHASIGMGPGDESEPPQSLAGTVAGLKAAMEADTRATRSELQGLHASIGMGPGDESEPPQSLAGTVAGLKAAMEADTRATQSALDGIQLSVGVSVGDELEAPKSLANTMAELKSAVEYSMPQLQVRRFELIDRTGSRTVYSLAGFDTGRNSLDELQRAWSSNVYDFLKACSKSDAPVIHLLGFASAQDFLTENFDKKRTHLCKLNTERQKWTDRNISDYNNCYLANQRVANLAAYFRYLDKPEDTRSEADYQGYATDILDAMNNHCKNRSDNTSFDVFRDVGIVKLTPWCSVGQMKDERFRGPGPADSETGKIQPHFLNRSVHIEILDAGKCAGW